MEMKFYVNSDPEGDLVEISAEAFHAVACVARTNLVTSPLEVVYFPQEGISAPFMLLRAK